MGLLSYYLLTILPHEEVGKSITYIFSAFTRDTYNLIIAVLVASTLILLSYYLFPKVKIHKERPTILIFTGITLIFILLCFNILFVNNIEAIHFLQYAIFSIICFKLTKNYTRTILIGALAGFFDELYQYMVLAPDTSDYFDFNDVVINIIGTGIGLIICKILTFKTVTYSKKECLFMPELWILIAMVIFYFYGSHSGIISVLQNPDNPSSFSFLKHLPESFWTTLPRQNIKYHILFPMPGLLISCILCLFYATLGINKT